MDWTRITYGLVRSYSGHTAAVARWMDDDDVCVTYGYPPKLRFSKRIAMVQQPTPQTCGIRCSYKLSHHMALQVPQQCRHGQDLDIVSDKDVKHSSHPPFTPPQQAGGVFASAPQHHAGA